VCRLLHHPTVKAAPLSFAPNRIKNGTIARPNPFVQPVIHAVFAIPEPNPNLRPHKSPNLKKT
jgi:hypothetical protein